jgi:hypothetical protein
MQFTWGAVVATAGRAGQSGSRLVDLSHRAMRKRLR